MAQPPQPYVPSPADIAEAEDLDFKVIKEEWQIYKLEDGSTLQIKITVFNVKRLKKWNPIDGTPLYAPSFNMALRVTNVPNKLKVPVMTRKEG